MVVLAIAGLALAAIVPRTGDFYDNIQRRGAMRDVRGFLLDAREDALISGKAADVLVNPRERRLYRDRGGKILELPDSVNVSVRGAAELNLDGVGVIRFYPDGGSSGGGLDVSVVGGATGSIDVDWLLGRVVISDGATG